MKINSVIAREDNGNIQLTFTIPNELVKLTKSEVVSEMAKDIQIPGFRKGNAPVSKVEERIDRNKLVEHILSHILPKAFSESVTEYKFTPALYPKFDAVKIEDDSDWEIRAVTCELPEVKLEDYKKKVAGELRASKIVVQGKEEQKITDDQVIDALLKSISVEIPKLLIEEEVNGRLSQLLSRIEKLGLTLEGYLASIKESVDTLRQKYETQAKEAITIELTLNKIALEEKLDVSDSEVNDFIKSTGSDPAKVDKNQIDTLKRVVMRRKALEKVASLV